MVNFCENGKCRQFHEKSQKCFSSEEKLACEWIRDIHTMALKEDCESVENFTTLEGTRVSVGLNEWAHGRVKREENFYDFLNELLYFDNKNWLNS